MIPIIKQSRDALAKLFPRKTAPKPLTPAQANGLARHWGRLNLQSVVRHVPKGAVFVHCHECRWPVNPGRTAMLLGEGQRTEATEEQMQRICEGVRQHMGVA
jgi:hypothetical protein